MYYRMRPPPTSSLFPYTTLFRSALVVPLLADDGREILSALVVASVFLADLHVIEFHLGGSRRFHDRKSTRLNSSHTVKSYAGSCWRSTARSRCRSSRNTAAAPSS